VREAIRRLDDLCREAEQLRETLAAIAAEPAIWPDRRVSSMLEEPVTADDTPLPNRRKVEQKS